MHVRTYGHHGFGSKLFDGELSEKVILDFLSRLAIGEWTPANNLPIIGYLDGIVLKPHIYSQFSKPYTSRDKRRTGFHTLKLMGRVINWRAATGSCTEIEFDNEEDALKIWQMKFPNAEICTNDNYIFGNLINGKEAGFEYDGYIFEMPEWDINVIRTHGYARVYIGDEV